MARVIYTAEATVTGGRANGHGRTNDGILDVQLRSPKEMGGEGGGTNPEQLFAVGYAACFESALGVVGRRERAEVGDVSIDSRVMLLPTEERGFKLAVELDVTLPQVQDPELAARLVAGGMNVRSPSSRLKVRRVTASPPLWRRSGGSVSGNHKPLLPCRLNLNGTEPDPQFRALTLLARRLPAWQPMSCHHVCIHHCPARGHR